MLGPVFGSTLKAMVMEMTLGLSDNDYAYSTVLYCLTLCLLLCLVLCLLLCLPDAGPCVREHFKSDCNGDDSGAVGQRLRVQYCTVLYCICTV